MTAPSRVPRLLKENREQILQSWMNAYKAENRRARSELMFKLKAFNHIISIIV
jgi:hypothetical protein